MEEHVPPLERFMVDLVALGDHFKDQPNPAPKDLKSDIATKWKLEEMEYQARRARFAQTG